jgi:hypothetical protein
MARPKSLKPKLCHNKADGRAYVKLDGRRVYLGKHDTQESRDGRKTPMTPNQAKRAARAQAAAIAGGRKRAPGEMYSHTAFNNAIRRACRRAGLSTT